jgi:predicted nuclease with TOPRIM domain
MQSSSKFRTGFLFAILWILYTVTPATAGVSQSIQDRYKKDYENKALFLRIPIYEEKQFINIRGQAFQAVPGIGSPLYKVGDQLRILQVDFGRDEIKFRLGALASRAEAEIIYQFDTDLQEDFPNRETFDRALRSTFTEGLKYSDIEDAQISFLREEFNRSIGQMAGAASLNREFVLEKIAPLIPDYRQTQEERDALKANLQDISTQLTQAQADNRKLESDLKEQRTELSRMISTNTSLQETITSSESQVSKLDKELRDAERKVQNFEREIADIKRSLNIETDSNRDLTKNNAELADRISALQEDLAGQKAANMKLTDEIEDKNKETEKLNSTIKTLTSNKNSLSSQYVKLKDEKEKLDDFALTVDALGARMVEEKTEDGCYKGQAEIYLGDVHLGSVNWSIPSYLNHNESGSGEATFYAESIDYVQVKPEVRRLLRTLGEKLKIRLNLVALSSTMTANSVDGTEPRELGERERSTWSWQIMNKGTQDVSFLLSASLVNSGSREISLFHKEQTVASSNPIRRIRSHLQPIPLAVGIILGFLLFGIVGIFRRPKKRKTPPKAAPPGPAEPKHYVNEKKL